MTEAPEIRPMPFSNIYLNTLLLIMAGLIFVLVVIIIVQVAHINKLDEQIELLSGNNALQQTPAAADTVIPTAGSTNENSPLVMIAPYADEAVVSSVNEAFSMRADNPYWGFVHPGVDFMITKPSIPVLAAAGGTIVNLEIKKEQGIMGWHAGFAIEYNKDYSVCYNLETFGSSAEVEQKLRENVLIKNGDIVTQGQMIANLIKGGDGAHIDFGVCTAGTRVCPEPFFTPAARESVLRLIHKTQPSWPMCDPQGS